MVLRAVPDRPAGEEEDVDEDNVVSLGDAASEALETGSGADQPVQAELVPACKVKFVGVAFDSLDEVPPLKGEVSVIVRGRVVGHETKVMKDGTQREVAKVDVTSVTPYGS